ncbi:MAG: ABC transporter ATP-binding protein [Thermoanaerobaculia bacterium]|nr:ABC transporter ATP-binding protein [Thermoanaerobaculia bacterium]
MTKSPDEPGTPASSPAGPAASDRRADPVVTVRSLVRRFRDVTAVDGIDFDVRRGEMFGLIGPDGAGKTTTLRCVLGLLRPDAGDVRTVGLDPVRSATELSHYVGYLSQRFSLYGDLSVDENIAFFADVHGVRDWKPRRDELLELLRMAPFRDRLAERLSGGMKQKLALACTLIHTPELLVLDEPTTGVDPVSRRDFWKILARLQREGLTLLLTTPYLDEAERCGRVALMDRGRFLAADEPDTIRASAAGLLLEVIAWPKRSAAEWLLAAPGVRDVQTFGERLHVSLPEASPSEGAAIAAKLHAGLETNGLAVTAVRPIVPTLEDVFIARVQSGAGTPMEVA